MSDLRGLAQRETGVMPAPTLDELVSRIGTLAAPYAADIGVDPLLAARLVFFVATVAAGIIREAEIDRIRAQTVVVRDERG